MEVFKSDPQETRKRIGFMGRRPYRAVAVVAAALLGGAMVVSTALAGYGTFHAANGNNQCIGYGATGAPPGSAYATTSVTSTIGVPLSSCVAGLRKIDWCDDWGCWWTAPGFSGTYATQSMSGAYSSNADHAIFIYPFGVGYGAVICTASWSGGTSSCP